ncbi:MAG: hypothetical protein CFE24_06765 [Flavobacterium sp. BFFFF2]|nr:MAG: hypothetical protein CFE24_06765 [Flavobacterium sp. BFFFF2]
MNPSIYQRPENPSLGKQYHEIGHQVFGFLAGKHILFYQIIDEYEIDILRILHQRMELTQITH